MMFVGMEDHRSVALAAMLTGMALSSVRMQRNSAVTQVRVRQTKLMNHQLSVLPMKPLNIQQKTMCNKWMVQVKSRQSLVRCTMYHIPTELKWKKHQYLDVQSTQPFNTKTHL